VSAEGKTILYSGKHLQIQQQKHWLINKRLQIKLAMFPLVCYWDLQLSWSTTFRWIQSS